MQHDIAARRIRRRDAPGPDVAEFVFDGLDIVRQREVRGQEPVIGLAQPVMTARDILRPERVFPQLEGALALRALQPFAFAQAGDVEHFPGRSLDGLDDVVIPGQSPAGFGERIDPRHALPAAVAIAHARCVAFVHQLDGGARAGLDPRGAGQTAMLVFEQRAGDVVLPPRQHAGEGPGVLDALAGARGQERHHRMRGVAEQRDPAGGPAVDRVAVIHAGDEGALALFEHGAGARLGVVERTQHLGDVAAFGPGFALHLMGRHRGQHAVELPGPHPVSNERAAGAEPVIAALGQSEALEPLCRDQRPPHQDVGEVLFLDASQMLAHHRMDAVAADQHVAAYCFAGLQADLDAVLVLGHLGAARAETFGRGRDRIEQDLDQVGAMDIVHRGAVARRRFVAERRFVQHAAAAQVAIIVGLRLDADGADRRFKADLAQHDRGVAGDLDAGADFVHDLGLLEHQRVDALMTQRNRSS